MPKILYIEDDLTKNIATIRKYFAPVLKDKRIQRELSDLENSERVYPEDIIQACKYSSELDIAYKFPIALERIVSNHKSYDLIIIDRDLRIYPYDDELEYVRELLARTGYDYSDDRIHDFNRREGDLLLLILLRINKSYKDKIYFLTANSGGPPDWIFRDSDFNGIRWLHTRAYHR